QKLVGVTLQQRHVPGDLSAEAGIAVGTERQAADEEDGELDVRLARDTRQERRLVLDRMGYEVGELHCTFRRLPPIASRFCEKTASPLLPSSAASASRRAPRTPCQTAARNALFRPCTAGLSSKT